MVEIVHIKDSQIPALKRSIACIGYFDGMHKGHQKLIRECVLQSERSDCIASMICFTPDPAEIIFNRKIEHLFSDEERFSLAESFGIKQIILIEFSRDFMKLDPSIFIHEYLEKMNLMKLICGYDFSFGAQGKGDVSFLKENTSIDTIVIEEESYLGSKISSTRIKEAVKRGDFSLSEELLGFPYYFILKCNKSFQNKDKWLSEYVLNDEGCIIPENGMYPDLFEVRNDRFYIENDQKPEENSVIRINTI